MVKRQRMPGTEKRISKIGGEPLTITVGENLSLKFTDFGAAGVMVTYHDSERPSYDQDSGVMLLSKSVDQLIDWMARTMGREAMALPIQTESILKRLLARDGASRLIPKAKRDILKQAVHTLEMLSGDGEERRGFRSMAKRALNR